MTAKFDLHALTTGFLLGAWLALGAGFALAAAPYVAAIVWIVR